uniref:Uncharacterized protein n=1 Tax=Amphimedon queenslandica TaxID=400682 RepID=A0A1X7VDC8_AMPQE
MPDVTVQQYTFNSRVRRKEESVAKFVEELRHMALSLKRGQLKPKKRNFAKQTNNIEEDDEKPDDVHNMFMVKKDHKNPIVVELTVEKEKLRWKSIQEQHCSSLVKL